MSWECRVYDMVILGMIPIMGVEFRKEITMIQPDLGLKVTELRQQKNLTQEQLAEKCEVSARTIQRIENGEVDPRSYSIQALGEALDFDFGINPTSLESQWLAVLHLSNIFYFVIIPLAIWSWKRTQSYKIDQQGRAVINFQITMILLLLASGLLIALVPVAFFMIGSAGLDPGLHLGLGEIMILCVPAPAILIGIFSTFHGIFNTMRALTDKPIHCPLTIPFIK